VDLKKIVNIHIYAMAYMWILRYINNMTGKRGIYYKGMRLGPLGLPILKDPKKTPRKERVREIYSISFNSPFQKDSPKNLIVMYDIPHRQKKERDWFRRNLKKFGYIMIQKSVWVGPSPLPKEFVEYLDEIKIGDNFMSFKLERPYTGKSRHIQLS
jgi:hypothetical protein